MTSRIDAVLEAARTQLRRLSAEEVPEAVTRGAMLVDIRPAAQRAAPLQNVAFDHQRRIQSPLGSDPTSEARLPQAVDDDVEWVVVCSEGYTSSLAAAALKDLGLKRATDVIGGYRRLKDSGVLGKLNKAGAQ